MTTTDLMGEAIDEQSRRSGSPGTIVRAGPRAGHPLADGDLRRRVYEMASVYPA